MKKFTFFIIAITLNINILYTQVSQEWIIEYNGTASMYDVPRKVLCDRAGNVYVAGYSGEISSSSADFILIKYSSAGKFLWKRTYNGPSSHFDAIVDAVIDNDGNIIVSGESRSNSDNQDFHTIKYDSLGNVMWSKSYDGPPHRMDVPRKICIDSQNNIYVTGVSSQYYNAVQTTLDILTLKYSPLGDSLLGIFFNNNNSYSYEEVSSIHVDNFGNIYLVGMVDGGNGYYNALILKYGINGIQVFEKRYDGLAHKDDSFSDIAVDNSGNAYALGSTTTLLPENFDYLLIKYNSNGDSLWVRKYNGIENDRDFGVSVFASSNDVLVTGYSDASSNNYDIVTLKYSLQGSLIWESRFDGAAHRSDSPAEVIKNSNEEIFIVGSSVKNISNNWDFALIKYNNDGILQWVQTYDGKNNDEDIGVSISFGQENEIYIAGWSGIVSDIVTIKYNDVIGIQNISSEVPDNFFVSQNFPNPFNPITNIRFGISRNSTVKLIVYDIIGREISILINRKLNTGTYTIDWDATRNPSGTYFYSLITEDFIETKKMVLIK